MSASVLAKIITGSVFSGLLMGGAAFADDQRQPDEAKKEEKVAEPFAFADFSWVPGNYAPAESPFNIKYFVPELRLDAAYHHSFNNPIDHTISGSSEVFRHGELQLTHIGVGGDFNYKNVGARFMTQFGMYSVTTPRNDASPAVGQWNLDNAYRYISEAYASYHLDVLSGINIQAGIFMSYIGLWSYYNFDNWTYQPSYVSSNTPWFFNGVRFQIFTSDKLKIEPWIINGWQSYGKFNSQPGLGAQILYRPTGWLSMVGNQYFGDDTLGTPGRKRFHTDDSVMAKYHEDQNGVISKAAATVTVDAGFESGGGTDSKKSNFVGFMAYNRLWLHHDTFGFTFGGGAINNPGRYLVLLPPINGATAASGAGAYFTQNPGDSYTAWDMQIAADYMPTRNITFRLEFNHRWASVPYFTGPGGVTPPSGTQTKNLGGDGKPDGTISVDGTKWGGPDLRKSEDRLTLAMMVRF